MRPTGRAGVMKNGRRLRTEHTPKPYQPPATPEGRINLTDPDSRVVKGLRGFIQGYNAQAVTTEHQVVIAAEVMVASPDFGHLEPMLHAAERELAGGRRHRAHRRSCSPTPATGTTSRWNAITDRGIEVLIPPDSSRRKGARPGWDGGALRVHARACSRPSTAPSSTANASR